MSILNKTLDHTQLATLDLLLNGAFAPLAGYLNQADHIQVLQEGRLANGYLWPLPLALPLTPAEKRAAQIAGRIALLDHEQRVIAEVKVEQVYRLPADIAALTNATADTWYVAGKVEARNKVLHPAFNRIRHTVPTLRSSLDGQGWKSVVAVHAAPTLNIADMQQACDWLKQTAASGTWGNGGMLVQISADEHNSDFHSQIRSLRANIRCNAAKQIKLSLLPAISDLSAERTLLLQALIARNYGATGFVVGIDVERAALRYLLQCRDEIGLDIIPVRHATVEKVNKALYKDGLLPVQQLEAAFQLAA